MPPTVGDAGTEVPIQPVRWATAWGGGGLLLGLAGALAGDADGEAVWDGLAVMPSVGAVGGAVLGVVVGVIRVVRSRRGPTGSPAA